MKNELLAPNGKPSNLNATQYKLVRTNAFKNWFGDWENDPANASKVVDRNGEPLVVYHGTNTDFTKFSLEKVGSNVDYGMWGSGFYFSPLRSFSKYYGSKILKLFLNIRNPFVRNPNTQGSKSQFKSVYGKEASLNLRNEILSYNYDGVLQFESGEKNPLTQIVTFEPNQIKLADGTNKTFDSSNDDIRFEQGGFLAPNGNISNLNAEQYKLVRTPAFKKWFGNWENDPENSSKVIDENGEPLVVYHGTSAKFNVFSDVDVKRSTMGDSVGFYFTPNQWTASRRSAMGDYIEVFLNIKNIVYLKKFSNDYDFISILGEELKLAKGLPDRAETYWFLKNGSAYRGLSDDNVGDVVKKLSQKKGIDGYYFLEFMSQEEGVVPVYVVFSSENVKLADGTNNDFDANNPDIRYEDGGEITNYKEFFDKLKIIDGSIYIGQKFYDVFPFLRRRKTPNDFRILVNQYNGILKRLKNDNFSSKITKQRDLNKLDRTLHIEKTKYLAKFYLDSKNTIIDFRNANYDDGGNLLLAPNGKSSNLNADQYKLVRTNAFKNWFGDWINDPDNASKVVDENGEPQVCYHGTFSKNLNFFDESKIGGNTGNEGHYGYGFYFSYSKTEASTYTYDTNPIILECFLNIRNPFLSSNLEHLEKYSNRYGYYEEKKPVAIDSNWLESELKKRKDQKPYLLYKSIKENGYEKGWELFLDKNEIDWNNETFDYNRINDWFEYDSSKEEFSKENEDENYNDEIPEYILENISEQLNVPLSEIKTIKQYTVGNYPSLLYMMDLGNRSRSLTDEIKQDGFDGIIAGSEIVLFKSSQIKIADGTNTTFDSSNNDIRFNKGGMIKAEDMLEHPLTIKRLQDLDDNNGFWVNQYHAKTKNYKPNTYYHLNTNGLNAGVGKGLYLGRDKDALISFYDLEGENKKVDTYVGNPNWLDLMKYEDYDRYEEEAIKKYGKNQVSKSPILDLDSRGEMLRKLAIEKGFDGIRYYDPQATGEEFVLFDVKKVKKIEDNVSFKNGGRTISQTPAPKQDRLYGSGLNKKSSSKDLSSAKLIKFDENTLEAIKNKVQTHNEQHPDKKINLSSAKAVVRRGMGAYSSSHRPTISGGKPNSRVAWGLARLNAFTYKIVNGKSKSGKYSQDDDLIEELGFKVADYKNGGKMSKDIRCINCGWEWDRKDSELWDMYVCHKCGFDNTSFYTSDPINRLLKGGGLNSNKGVTPEYLKMFLDL